MSEDKKTTTVAIPMRGQEAIPEMLEKVLARIKSIKGGMPKAPKATGSLSGFGKVEDMKTVDSIIKAYSSVMAREERYKAAASKLLSGSPIKTPPFKLNGSSAADWYADMEAKIVLVANKTELEKLNQVKEKLESNLSAEAKLAKDLNDIAGILDFD